MSKIDPNRPDVVAFVAKVSQELGQDIPPPKDVFNFGNDRILGYALDGSKTATTSWPVPDPLYWGPGDYSVITNNAGEPVAVMITLSFQQCKFKEVEEDFALAEGEGDYEEYRKGHFWWYGQQENGHEFNDESMVLCERFRLVYPKLKEAK